MQINNEEKSFIYRGYLGKILYFFHNGTIVSDSYKQIKEYYDVGEEGLCLNLIIKTLIKQDEIPFKLGKAVLDILEIYPADGTYVNIESADKLVNILNKSQIHLK